MSVKRIFYADLKSVPTVMEDISREAQKNSVGIYTSLFFLFYNNTIPTGLQSG